MAAHLQQTYTGRRRFDRYHVDLSAVALFTGGQASVRVLDLSYGGARLELPLHSSLYQPQGIRSLRIAGAIDLRVVWRWSQDRQTGVEFVASDMARTGIARLIEAQGPPTRLR